MIKMFVMQTCPYCEYVEKQVEGNPHFEVIDISKHVRNLKQFLDLRDNHPFRRSKEDWRCRYSMLCIGRWYCNPVF